MADINSPSKSTWVNVTAAGELALAIAVIGLGAQLLGRLDSTAGLILGIWIACGGLIHLAVGVGCQLKGLNTNANAFWLFGTFLMLASGIEFVVRYLAAVNGWGPIAHTVNGYMWIPIWFAVWFWTPSILKEAPLVFILTVLCLDIAFPITSLLHLKILGHAAAPVAGYCLWIAGALTTYMGGATVMNASFGRSILPLGAPIIKPKVNVTSVSHHG